MVSVSSSARMIYCGKWAVEAVSYVSFRAARREGESVVVVEQRWVTQPRDGQLLIGQRGVPL